MNAVLKTLRWPSTDRDRKRSALWTADEIAEATGGAVSGAFQAAGVEMDSRDVRSGDLFFALKGESLDGHLYVEKAFANGAAAAVVEQPIPQPHVLVENTSSALEALAKAARKRASARVVGVTLSLSRMPARSTFGVFEMGMNHAGEILGLTAQVRPHVAVITTIAPAHIENLGSEEAIADAKAEIFGGLERGGTAVIPSDSPHFARLRDAALECGAKILSFGKARDADVRLLDAVPSANGGSLVTAALGERRLCYTVAEPGEHWIDNSLAVMGAVYAAGGDLGAAGLALAEMGGLKGRGARHRIAVPGGHALLIDESYNANPASMRATLAQLGATPASRRIAVLGSMKELGDFAASFHAQLVEPIAQANVDFAILVGPEMIALARELGKGAHNTLGKPLGFAHCEGPGEAIAALEEFGLVGGDAVLVKGSNSVGLARVVAHFAAREG